MKETKRITGVGIYETPRCTSFNVESEGMLCVSGNTETLGNEYNFTWEESLNNNM